MNPRENNNNSIEATYANTKMGNSNSMDINMVTTSSSTLHIPMITVVEAATAAASIASNAPAIQTAANVSTSSIMTSLPSNGDAQNMRLILPVFIQNERKCSQPGRQRKIQSSPVKSMRRFSQDSSDLLGKHLNVSQPYMIRYIAERGVLYQQSRICVGKKLPESSNKTKMCPCRFFVYIFVPYFLMLFTLFYIIYNGLLLVNCIADCIV